MLINWPSWPTHTESHKESECRSRFHASNADFVQGFFCSARLRTCNMLSIHRPEQSCSSYSSADEDFIFLYKYQCFGWVYFLHLQGGQRGVRFTVIPALCSEKDKKCSKISGRTWVALCSELWAQVESAVIWRACRCMAVDRMLEKRGMKLREWHEWKKL
jgi:hypothetical protein